MNLKLNKVVTLPGTLDGDSVYFVKGGGDTYSDLIVTDSAGNGVEVVSDARINSLITGATNTEIALVATIAARDALVLTQNSLVLVSDASADPTVNSGAAMYFYNFAGTTFVKVTEFESLDITYQWADIVGKPTSTPAAIDAAVTDSHTHTNKAIIDGITNVGSGIIISAAERTLLNQHTTDISTNASNITTNSGNITTLQGASHTHANKVQLDKITENGSSEMLYNGVFPTYWTTVGW